MKEEFEITAKIRDVTEWGGVVVGTISGDKKGRFRDGDQVRTSLVKRVLIVTANSVYETDETALRKPKIAEGL